MKQKDRQIEILRQKSPPERLKLAFELHEFARQRISSELSRTHPELKPHEISNLVKKRFTHGH